MRIFKLLLPLIIAALLSAGYATAQNDGLKRYEKGYSNVTYLETVTPGGNSALPENYPKARDLQENDAWGGMLTITSMLVVFIVLIGLYIFSILTGNYAKTRSQKNVAKSGRLSAARSQSQLSGEVLAAISAAIYEMKGDPHDIESTILTIQQVERNYSPWSAKRQSLRELPR